jgi:UDP:flavonoid glycosyltransferase YjiC (YdhE family)
MAGTMENVLLTWELGGGLGHCVNLAPLAAGLASRGHVVYFAARDVVTAQKALPNAAVKFLQSPGVIARPAHALRQPRSFAQVLDQVAFGDDCQLRAVVESWRNLMELVKPAVLVCEHSPSALLASRWTDARRVVIGTGFTQPPDVSPLPDLCPWMGPSPIDLVRHETGLLDRANRLLAADKLPPLERLSQLYADVDEEFLVTFRELDHHLGRELAEYLGTWSLPGGVAANWPEGDGPRVFAYLKSLPGVFRLESALAVLRELPAKTLAYVPNAAKSVLDLESPSLRICREPVDMSVVLERCDLAILNGTMGTATQCLLAGVPLVMMPPYLEQTIVSRRVVELGAGLIVPPNRIELLAGRIWRVLLDDRFRQAAKSFADRYENHDPKQSQQLVLDRIESLLTNDDGIPARLDTQPSILNPQLSTLHS